MNAVGKGAAMSVTPLDLPDRTAKPRPGGLTMVIDNGLPSAFFADALASAEEYIDVVKFGWGTSLVTADLQRKIDCAHDHGVRCYFGGTLFEKFVAQRRFDEFLAWCRRWGCDMVEVSNGTIPLTNAEKAEYICACAREFPVLSEVGFKDVTRSDLLTAGDWAEAIAQDLDAGASLVITEARESGQSGICNRDGTVRDGVVEAVLASGVDADSLLFEAPTKALQTHFIKLVGPNVNLGNVALADVIGLETLRLGLRSDTLLDFEAMVARA
jgi:phosphosulfolactate synthase